MSTFYLPNSRQDVFPMFECYIELDGIEEVDEDMKEEEDEDESKDYENNMKKMREIDEQLNKIIYNQWLKGIGLGISIGLTIGYFIGKLK